MNLSNKLTKRIGGLMMALMAPGLFAFSANVVAEEAVSEAKAIRLVDDKKGKDLRVSISPLKKTYKVGEPIRFRVRGNQEFFLYMFSVDKDGDTTMLMPNNRHSGNKYPGNRRFKAPSNDVVFAADRPGSEEVVVIASKKWIEVDKSRYAKSGDFWTADEDSGFSEFSSKGIVIRGPEPEKTAKDGVVVKKFDLKIKGKARRVVVVDDEQEEAGVPFVSANRARYNSGDDVKFTYGADQDGWVHLFVVEPGGAYEKLLSQSVRANRAYRKKAIAEAPQGRHALVAVYTEKKRIDADDVFYESTLSKSVEDFTTKGLRLEGDDAEQEDKYAKAVYRFYIRD